MTKIKFVLCFLCIGLGFLRIEGQFDLIDCIGCVDDGNEFSNPNEIEVDDYGNVYVVDITWVGGVSGRLLRKFNGTEEIILSNTPFSSDGMSIYINSENELYVATNESITIYSSKDFVLKSTVRFENFKESTIGLSVDHRGNFYLTNPMDLSFFGISSSGEDLFKVDFSTTGFELPWKTIVVEDRIMVIDIFNNSIYRFNLNGEEDKFFRGIFGGTGTTYGVVAINTDSLHAISTSGLLRSFNLSTGVIEELYSFEEEGNDFFTDISLRGDYYLLNSQKRTIKRYRGTKPPQLVPTLSFWMTLILAELLLIFGVIAKGRYSRKALNRIV